VVRAKAGNSRTTAHIGAAFPIMFISYQTSRKASSLNWKGALRCCHDRPGFTSRAWGSG